MGSQFLRKLCLKKNFIRKIENKFFLGILMFPLLIKGEVAQRILYLLTC